MADRARKALDRRVHDALGSTPADQMAVRRLHGEALHDLAAGWRQAAS